MKEVLIAAGFIYGGQCSICGGQAELYNKSTAQGNVQVKAIPRKMKFELTINKKKYTGKSNELQAVLEKYNVA